MAEVVEQITEQIIEREIPVDVAAAPVVIEEQQQAEEQQDNKEVQIEKEQETDAEIQVQVEAEVQSQIEEQNNKVEEEKAEVEEEKVEVEAEKEALETELQAETPTTLVGDDMEHTKEVHVEIAVEAEVKAATDKEAIPRKAEAWPSATEDKVQTLQEISRVARKLSCPQESS